MRRFTIVLTPDPDEGGFTVSVPSLPGCVTVGHTFEEAMANAKAAVALHLDGLTADGERIPDDSPAVITFIEIADDLTAGS